MPSGPVENQGPRGTETPSSVPDESYRVHNTVIGDAVHIDDDDRADVHEVVNAVMRAINCSLRQPVQRSTNTLLARSRSMCLDHTRGNGGVYTSGVLDFFKGPLSTEEKDKKWRRAYDHAYEKINDKMPRGCSVDAWSSPGVIYVKESYAKSIADGRETVYLGDYCKRAAGAVENYQRDLKPVKLKHQESWDSDDVMHCRKLAMDAFASGQTSDSDDFLEQAVEKAQEFEKCMQNVFEMPTPINCLTGYWESKSVMRIRFEEALASARHEYELQMKLHAEAMYTAYKVGIRDWNQNGERLLGPPYSFQTEEAIKEQQNSALREWQHCALAALDANDMETVFDLQKHVNTIRKSRHQVPVSDEEPSEHSPVCLGKSRHQVPVCGVYMSGLSANLGGQLLGVHELSKQRQREWNISDLKPEYLSDESWNSDKVKQFRKGAKVAFTAARMDEFNFLHEQAVEKAQTFDDKFDEEPPDGCSLCAWKSDTVKNLRNKCVNSWMTDPDSPHAKDWHEKAIKEAYRFVLCNPPDGCSEFAWKRVEWQREKGLYYLNYNDMKFALIYIHQMDDRIRDLMIEIPSRASVGIID